MSKAKSLLCFPLSFCLLTDETSARPQQISGTYATTKFAPSPQRPLQENTFKALLLRGQQAMASFWFRPKNWDLAQHRFSSYVMENWCGRRAFGSKRSSINLPLKHSGCVFTAIIETQSDMTQSAVENVRGQGEGVCGIFKQKRPGKGISRSQ